MKQWAKAFYTSREWKQCRVAYRKYVGGLCEPCLKRGYITAGEIVHHKIFLTPENINNPEIALNFDNLELVCRDCHAQKHGSMKRYKVDELGRVTIKDDP